MRASPVRQRGGQRVGDLRRLLVVTQKELSSLTGIAQSNLSDIERGQAVLTVATAHRICSATGMPIQFFDFATPEYSSDDINFRKNARVSAKGRDFVVQSFKEIERLSLLLADAPVRLRRTKLPFAEQADIVGDRDIELFAVDVRESLGVAPDMAVRNVTRAAERAGIAIAPLSVPVDRETLLDGHCGMSRWDKSAPRASVAFISGMPGDRQRFTLAHELGHVLLHSQRNVDDIKQREKEADRFAGALLLPQPIAESAISESLTLQGYMRIKATFGIAIQAIITRAQRLGLISRERQRSLMIQISSRGWRKAEPVGVRNESPVLMWTELTAICGPNPYFAASSKFGIAPRLLEQWIPVPQKAKVENAQSDRNVIPLDRG